ncbi:MAG: Si-specific NAD(P)(+) transhydrogenase [Chlamydiae bacterium]|nr:Si-specific NAD(P)(+) transhydrogenase [Chlamydiota bacterium]
MSSYDLIVIGTGPSGEKAAVKAAYFGYKVAIVEKESIFGGAEVVTGTIPSKTLKETALFLSGKYEKGLFGIDRNLQHEASVKDFMFRKNYVSNYAAQEILKNLKRHGVDIYKGVASFLDANNICIQGENNINIQGTYILIATGSYPFHPSNIPFDGKRIHDSDTILEITRFPSSICIIGAGVIGCEYATIFSTMGAKVHLINDKEKILPFVDKEISQNLLDHMHKEGIEIFFNCAIESIKPASNENELIEVKTKSGQIIKVDMFLFAAGRSGNTKALKLDKLGIKMGKRETIEVNSTYQTSVPNIYAVGDVIGFPSLASTSMDQGRAAVAHIFKTKDLENLPKTFPYGIYTIPEISMVGITEEEAKEKKINYCSGKAMYADMARGQIMGAKNGFMKIIFCKDTLTILGIHIIGNIATEMIHYGISLVEDQKTLYNVIGTVFNFPTLHELYKYACYDGLSNLSGHKIKP